MMLTAPRPGCLQTQRFEADDRRADGRRRVILVDRVRIQIARSVGGIFMRVSVPARDYQGVALHLTREAEAYRFRVELRHRDPELSVLLAESADDRDIQADWRLWAKFLTLPALVGREGDGVEPFTQTLGGVNLGRATPRRRGRATTKRRPRFLTRRKVGVKIARRAPIAAN